MIKNRHILHLSYSLICLITPYLIGVISPNIETEESLCISKRFFNLPCPGCGLLKSFICFFKGDLKHSFDYHPLGMALIGIVFISGVLAFIDLIFKKDLWLKLADSQLFWFGFSLVYFSLYFVRLIFGII